MSGKLQRQFNDHVFDPDKHLSIKKRMEEQSGPQRLRLCETPVLLEEELFNLVIETGREITERVLSPEMVAKMERFIPPEFDAPNRTEKPEFVLVDFAISRDAEQNLVPKLIELQASPSFFHLQNLLSKEFSRAYGLEDRATWLPQGLTEEEFLEDQRQIILGGHHPRHVVLMDIDPDRQLTSPDFRIIEKELGIRAVAVDQITKFGNKLYYTDGEQLVEIKRLYNRIMNEEFDRLKVAEKTGFKFTDELDVEWVAHPHWSYLISKACIPELDPQTHYLNEVTEYPEDLHNYVLKPLFAYGGHGVKIGPAREDLDAIPAEKRGEYLFMPRKYFADFIDNPDGKKSTVEVRVMYVIKGEEIKPAILMGRVAHGNTNSLTSAKLLPGQEWVGLAAVMCVGKAGLVGEKHDHDSLPPSPYGQPSFGAPF